MSLLPQAIAYGRTNKKLRIQISVDVGWLWHQIKCQHTWWTDTNYSQNVDNTKYIEILSVDRSFLFLLSKHS